MPFRSMTTLESWVDEFRSQGYPLDVAVKVMGQDGDDGANTGLVGVVIAHSSVVIYIQPESTESDRWIATFEARESSVELDAPSLLRLASELTTISALCAFLQAKSVAYVGQDSA